MTTRKKPNKNYVNNSSMETDADSTDEYIPSSLITSKKLNKKKEKNEKNDKFIAKKRIHNTQPAQIDIDTNIKMENENPSPKKVKKSNKMKKVEPEELVKNFKDEVVKSSTNESELVADCSDVLFKGNKRKAKLNTASEHHSKRTKLNSGKIKEENDFEFGKLNVPNGSKIENEFKQEAACSTSGVDDTKHGKFELGSGINWEADLLSEMCDINYKIAVNIIQLFQMDCTVPFIARYRGELTNQMDADILRYVKDTYSNKIQALQTKANSVITKLRNSNKLNKDIERSIKAVKSLEELEHIYAPYKPGGKKTKADRARDLGLEKIAIDMLEGNTFINDLDKLVDVIKDGLRTVEQVIEGIKHIIADIFSKDIAVLDCIRQLQRDAVIQITSKKLNHTLAKNNKNSKDNKRNNDETEKFQIYYDFTTNVKRIQPHQILALNRGEALKVLSVKFIVPNWVENQLNTFCWNKWMKDGCKFPLRIQLFKDSFKDSYNRLIQPLIIRRIRSQLNEQAEKTAIESFGSNLKYLLLQPPVRGSPILGIDPGFRNGCKFALISGSGDVLWTKSLFIDFDNQVATAGDPNIHSIKKQLILHRCELIAVGNGCGCRQMEKYLASHISKGTFKPEIDVQYTIVNERGSSIYSCSPLAKEEFPTLDPKLISAVFIARSLQDPLSELVKVEPKHLGVGMYQHDMPDKQLNLTLDEIVVACVSFAGVDINTASIHLLKRISGLNSKRASAIIEWRNKNGAILNRQKLLEIKSIGKKTFEQCGGFIRVIPETAMSRCQQGANDDQLKKVEQLNLTPLDRTWIHPEAYSVAYRFLDLCKANLKFFGTNSFINTVNNFVNNKGIEAIASELTVSVPSIIFIKDSLTRPLDYDYRTQFAKPVFRKQFSTIDDLRTGVELTGCVTNVTSFGAFTDIGMGIDGLIHNRQMKGIQLAVGDRVNVKVLSVEIQRKRVALSLSSKVT